MSDLDRFFSGKRVMITGHTGFKGAWLATWLHEMGADVIGVGLDPYYENSVYDLAGLKDRIVDLRCDIRDLSEVHAIFESHEPEVLFHLAAQALVRTSYAQPRDTFETNVMGTINIIECTHRQDVRSVVLITSDKCYKNVEQQRGYVETDPMSDDDPYSTSKGCAEMAVQSYRKSFGLRAATARAGNVVGGGDWSVDRLVPDIIRAIAANKPVVLRNPNATRPWQFVLEAISGYLILAKKLYEGENVDESWNFGPKRSAMVPVEDLVRLIINEWGNGEVLIQPDPSRHEPQRLFLDCKKSKRRLGWRPKLDIHDMVKFTVEWYKHYRSDDVYDLCVQQIRRYTQR